MLIDSNGREVPVIVLPRDHEKFIEFLFKHGFNPVRKASNRGGDGTAVFLDKPYEYYEMNPLWNDYSGYSALLKKFLDKSFQKKT
jgi:hypothetical protein